MPLFGLISTLTCLVLGPGGSLRQCPDTANPPNNVVEVVARGMQFEAPTEVSAGWITFRLRNESGMTHFAVVERLPEGVGVESHQNEVAPVFQRGMDLLDAGRTEEAVAVFGELPAWFGNVVFKGGPGLVAPGRTGETTVHLEPGTYLLECYVKTEGVFHSFNPVPGEYGMVHELAVTRRPSGAPEPRAGLTVSISSDGGIAMDGVPNAGEQVVAVRFLDQTVHEHFLGHDVHLARLDPGTDLEALGGWMNWMAPGGLETPAPVQFLGGVEEMPAGETGYLRVNLEPGRYAWISEVPDPAGKGMLKIFDVPSGKEK